MIMADFSFRGSGKKEYSQSLFQFFAAKSLNAASPR